MNRREVLTGMAVAGATVALSAPTIARGLPASRSAWNKAMANLDRAKAASDAYEPEYWRIEAAYRADVESVPHVMVQTASRSVSTADLHEVAWARHSARNTRYVEACAYDLVRDNQRLADAADARDAQIAAINQLHR